LRGDEEAETRRRRRSLLRLWNRGGVVVMVLGGWRGAVACGDREREGEREGSRQRVDYGSARMEVERPDVRSEMQMKR